MFNHVFSGQRQPFSPADFLYSWWTVADHLAEYQQQARGPPTVFVLPWLPHNPMNLCMFGAAALLPSRKVQAHTTPTFMLLLPSQDAHEFYLSALSALCPASIKPRAPLGQHLHTGHPAHPAQGQSLHFLVPNGAHRSIKLEGLGAPLPHP